MAKNDEEFDITVEPLNQVLTESDASSLSEQTRTYHISIAGVSFKLRSSTDEKAVALLVEMVERSIQESLSRSKSLTIQNAAILASLNFAEKYVAAVREKEKLEQHFAQVTQGVRQRLQKVVVDSEDWLKHLSEVISK